MNEKELFATLLKDEPLKAQVVGKNIITNFPEDFDFIEQYLSFCIENIDSQDIEISQFFISESESTLQFYSEICNMTEESLNKIDSYSASISKRKELLFQKKEKYNDGILIKIEKALEHLNIGKKSQRGDAMKKIKELDSNLQKEYFSESQTICYNNLSDKISQSISKMAKLSAIEQNRKALSSYKEALEMFNAESKYKKDPSLLKTLIKTHFCLYDTNSLDSEVNMYYNYVYNYIFSKVNDEMKYYLVEVTINSKKR